MHAEHHAICRCNNDELEGSTIVIVTVSRKSGNMTDATPCAFCMQSIHRVGIKEIIMTTLGSGFKKRYSNRIDKDWVSQSCRDMLTIDKKKAYIAL